MLEMKKTLLFYMNLAIVFLKFEVIFEAELRKNFFIKIFQVSYFWGGTIKKSKENLNLPAPINLNNYK